MTDIHFDVRTVRLSPAEAEIWISATGEIPPDSELRGRLIGPICHGWSTVQIAYPLRPIPGAASQPNTLQMRVVVPDPSLWDLDSPNSYTGPVEVVSAGKRIGAGQVTHGLRALHLGVKGLRLNGSDVRLIGLNMECHSPGEVAVRKQQGHNLIVVKSATREVMNAANQLGMLVLYQGSGSPPHPHPLSPGREGSSEDTADEGRGRGEQGAPNSPLSPGLAGLQNSHGPHDRERREPGTPNSPLSPGPERQRSLRDSHGRGRGDGGEGAITSNVSCLGLLRNASTQIHPSLRCPVGLELDEPLPEELPIGISFLVCREDLLPTVLRFALPTIVRTKNAHLEGVGTIGVLLE